MRFHIFCLFSCWIEQVDTDRNKSGPKTAHGKGKWRAEEDSKTARSGNKCLPEQLLDNQVLGAFHSDRSCGLQKS